SGRIGPMPEQAAGVMQRVVQEGEAEETTEALLGHDADKIETLLQARECKAQGRYNTDAWEESSVAALKTDTGRKVAEAVEDVDPEEWWKASARSYRELRRSSRGARNAIQP